MVALPLSEGADAPARRGPLPIFLISYNRGAMLERAVRALRRQDRETSLVVQDNGSDDPETLHVLERLSGEGVEVHRGVVIGHPDELESVNALIDRRVASHGPTPYAVSDCDIDLSPAGADALSVYEAMLDALPEIEVAGPMLRIRDIPTEYPLYNRVMNRHIEQFWRLEPQWMELEGRRIAYIPAPIDTTLAVHRAGAAFRRLRRGVRLYEPYEALHLDWYRTQDGPDVYAATSSPSIAHWNNARETEAFRHEPLRHTGFHAVRRTPDGYQAYWEALTPSARTPPEMGSPPT